MTRVRAIDIPRSSSQFLFALERVLRALRQPMQVASQLGHRTIQIATRGSATGAFHDGLKEIESSGIQEYLEFTRSLVIGSADARMKTKGETHND
jgi:hypothetical protein